jgi:uncharacterized membrane protein (DUF4010 family)
VNTLETLTTLGISLGMGLLVGLQREWRQEKLAGIRTFALLTLFGTLCGLLGREWGAWIVAAGVVGVAALMAAGSLVKARMDAADIGLTTEFAALVMFGLGAYLAVGDRTAAVVTGGVVALLLHWKEPLHGVIRKMGDGDVAAIMRFVLIALVILPVLPREDMGPYGALNPFNIWLVVVLVVGMSLAGYVLHKLVPPRAGALLGGAAGGLVSSTATTVSYARRTREDPEGEAVALQAIMTANTVSILRVMVLVSLFAGGSVGLMMQPLAGMAGGMGVLTVIAFMRGRWQAQQKIAQENPAELRSALLFGVLYAAVRLAIAWCRDVLGVSALYAVGALSGSTDMDAITLSISDMAQKRRIDMGSAARVVLIAILANLVFKGGCILFLGSAGLRRSGAMFFGGALALGGVIMVLMAM